MHTRSSFYSGNKVLELDGGRERKGGGATLFYLRETVQGSQEESSVRMASSSSPSQASASTGAAI